MSKKLTARVQKLNPTIKEQEKGFSFGVVIEPESKEVILSKGNIYAVFDVSSSEALDTTIVTKVVHDVLHDTYYNSDNVSPIQSLEKAVSAVKEKVTQLPQNSILVDTNIEFNATVSVLWGNVFYVVQYGKGAGHLMRDNDVKPIQASGEGNFASTSGVVRDDDVAILCTDSFVKKFPPRKLLTSAMSEKDLDSTDACLLLKFIEDTSVSEADFTNLNPVSGASKQKVEIIVDSIINRIQSLGTKKANEGFFAATPKVIGKKSFSKKHMIIAGVVLLVVFGGFGIYSLFKNRPPKGENISEETVQFADEQIPASEIEEDYSRDKELKVERVKVENTLYDLIIADESVSPSEIDIYKNKLIVTDMERGKIYTSLLGDYKFLPIEETFSGIKNIVMDSDGNMLFGSNSGINVYDVTNLELVKTYTSSYSGGIGVFGDYIYTFEGSKLVKYTKSGDSLEASTWGEASDFNNAKNIQIAYSVYIVTADNNIVKYTLGNKDSFEASGLETPLGNVVDMVVKEDFDNIYVADKDNKRVVVFDLNGKFVKQYKYMQSIEWENLNSIAVDANEETLYVLSGTKIYEISL